MQNCQLTASWPLTLRKVPSIAPLAMWNAALALWQTETSFNASSGLQTVLTTLLAFGFFGLFFFSCVLLTLGLFRVLLTLRVVFRVLLPLAFGLHVLVSFVLICFRRLISRTRIRENGQGAKREAGGGGGGGRMAEEIVGLQND